MNNLINRIRCISFLEANNIIERISGIVDFFTSESDKTDFVNNYESSANLVCDDRVSYGDWQTPIALAEKVCETHLQKFGEPDIIIEPTCGRGAFVFAALKTFHHLSEIHAIDINQDYIRDLKLNLLLNALTSPLKILPRIYIHYANFFDFDFSAIIRKGILNDWNLAIIGNPPWVTNSTQGKNLSENLPVKRNSFGLKGLDAVTGKSNFDISESITLHLLRLTQITEGGISFLLKNSVIRNIITKQHAENIHIADLEQQQIDAPTEFNVSVDASCFSARFNRPASLICTIKDFYSHKFIQEFGWIKDSFVADTKQYLNFSKYDRSSSYVWRSGMKHDCAPILELSRINGQYINGLGETVEIENDLIYPLLKSSDVNKSQDITIRKYIIVPQKKIGQDTSTLKHSHPLAYSYFSRHEDIFKKRKSRIYKDKDKFSVFGIGDYSFSKYKIVISSLYKTISFKLVSEFEGKPILVDDTCYQLDFDNFVEAKCIHDALNSPEIQSLLHSLIFLDAKRVITKNLLMRLDLAQLCKDKGIRVNSKRFANGCSRQQSLFD